MIKTFPLQDTIVHEEYLRYDLLDFIAEFGGILGLLIGASILSVYDFMEGFLKRFIGYLKSKKGAINSK